MAELIPSAREERSKLAAARGMEGIGERLAEAEALVAEKLERVTGRRGEIGRDGGAWWSSACARRRGRGARIWSWGERSGGRGDAGLLGRSGRRDGGGSSGQEVGRKRSGTGVEERRERGQER